MSRFINNLAFFIKYFIIVSIIKKVLNDCTIEEPILLKNGDCVAQYCTEEQFKNEDCIIDNTIIKTQWLNNIIWVGNKDFRCINIQTFSNGDFIIETTASPENSFRLFYGLKNNGRIFFSKNNSNYFSMEAKDQITNEGNGRNEADVFIAKINIDNIINEEQNEYLVSVGKREQFTELYDFNEDKIYQISTNLLFGRNVDNLGTSVNFKFDNFDVVLFGYLGEGDESGTYYFYLHLLNFTNKDIENNGIMIYKNYITEDEARGESITCFITELKKIICFYLSINYKPTIIALDEQLNFLKSFTFTETMNEEFNFFKCIHLINEVGVFIFYSKKNKKNIPCVYFKNYINNNFENYFSKISMIYLDQLNFFNAGYLLSDLIKLSNHKICYISISENKKILYIITMNIFGENNIIPRYYYVDLYTLYNYKFFLDIRASLYKNFLSLAFSFCQNENCEDEETDEHYSAFLIFSYSNSTDYSLNIEQYLFNNNDIKINNITIDLKDNVTIENNLFGYVYASIKINDLINCTNINLYSTIKDEVLIDTGYILEQNEKIKLEFISNVYGKIKCRIIYEYNVTEPEFKYWDIYPEIKDISYGGEETEEIYNSQKNFYVGRMSFYEISIENDLETKCFNKNCELCLKKDINYCLTCSYNFSFDENENEIKNKICYIEKEAEEEIYEEIQIEEELENKKESEEDENKEEKEIENKEESSIEKMEEEKEIENKGKSNIENIEEEYLEDNESIKINEDEKENSKDEEENYLIKENEGNESGIENEKDIEYFNEYENESKNEKEEENKDESIEEIKEKENNKNNIEIEEREEFMEEEKIEEEEEKEGKLIENQSSEELNDIICSKEKILKNECIDGILNSEQIQVIFNQIKEDLFNNLYKDENRIIITKNVLFQTSTLEQQKLTNNSNISSIDFGECENLLKQKYNISLEDQIKIVKLDIKDEDLSTIYVQYELYDPNVTQRLNLSVCESTKIFLNVPNNLESNTYVLYKDLENNGYNLFNPNDSFYNDICSTYTTSDNTDILLNDRQKDYFIKNGNITLCQSNCRFKLYNITNNQSKCECSIQEESSINTNISELIFDHKMIEDIFINSFTHSNFMVLKCYKLGFNLDFKNNIGQIIMSIIYIVFLVFLIIFSVKDRKKIIIYINYILKNKFGFVDKNNKVKKIKKKNNKNNINKNNNINNDHNNNVIINYPPKKKKNSNNKLNINKNSINLNNNSLRKADLLNSGNDLVNNIENQSQNMLSGNNINIVVIKKYYGKKKKIKKTKKKKTKKDVKIFKSKHVNVDKNEKNVTINKNINEIADINYNDLNDYELNNLKYEEALIYDKRNYCKFYWSLLKTRHFILFTFLPNKDYNLVSLKICTFLICFSWYYIINAFFFQDKTMHKIYLDKGKYNIIYQMPSVIYSTIISSLLKYLLKLLSLSEQSILTIKKQNKSSKALKKSVKIQKYLNIKFIIFFILGNIFLLFFWYYISCFCAVYINTQIILFKDTLLCFLLSMTYPFAIYLFPGIFRIPSLISKNKDKKCFYRFSQLLSLI